MKTLTLSPEMQALKNITTLFADIRADYSGILDEIRSMDSMHLAVCYFVFGLQKARHPRNHYDFSSFMSQVKNNRFRFTDYQDEILSFIEGKSSWDFMEYANEFTF